MHQAIFCKGSICENGNDSRKLTIDFIVFLQRHSHDLMVRRAMLNCTNIQSFAHAMPRHQLPDFASPSTENLRELYRTSDDDLTRRTVLEVIRLRALVAEADYYREVIHKCWNAEGLGRLVALENFRVLMLDERSRMGLPRVRVDDGAPSDGQKEGV